MEPSILTEDQKDRAAGVLLGLAVGDALGVPYEFAAPMDEDSSPEMKGGGLGPYKPGEYSDDTQMAVCIANVAATGVDLRRAEALDAIAANFLRWPTTGASDMGNLTRAVLGRAPQLSGSPAEQCRGAAREHYERTGSAFGNGALMRTAPVALFALVGRAGDGRAATAEAAREIALLTHADPRAGDACVLWCEAIRLAVLEGRLDLAAGLDLIPEARDAAGDGEQPDDPRAWWADIVDEASHTDWRMYVGRTNGSTSNSLRVAWSAIVSTDGSDHFRRALDAVVHIGHDTDTTAAIAGSLLGARYGAAAVPAEWRSQVNGWPGPDGGRPYRDDDLMRLGLLTVLGGRGA